VDESLVSPTPVQIGVIDDVLTNGSHFVAAKRVLQRRFPGVPVIGIFFARREIVE
jgi:predicted amidophosphoribosyltransferase